MGMTDDDGTPLRRDTDGDLIPDIDPRDTETQRRRDAIRRCREAIQLVRQKDRP